MTLISGMHFPTNREEPVNRLFTVCGDCSAVMDVHAAVLAALRNRIRVL
jgi:hypothetical protein